MFFFCFNDTATTEIYTLSLHDALPISSGRGSRQLREPDRARSARVRAPHLSSQRHRRAACAIRSWPPRSEEHTSELQSLRHLVCRLLLEKKKNRKRTHDHTH